MISQKRKNKSDEHSETKNHLLGIIDDRPKILMLKQQSALHREMGGGETSAHKMKLSKRKENRRKALEKYIESSTKT
jgi:hypothetical protein